MKKPKILIVEEVKAKREAYLDILNGGPFEVSASTHNMLDTQLTTNRPDFVLLGTSIMEYTGHVRELQAREVPFRLFSETPGDIRGEYHGDYGEPFEATPGWVNRDAQPFLMEHFEPEQ